LNAHGCLDIVIDGVEAIRTFERNSTGRDEEILIFGRMTLQFYIAGLNETNHGSNGGDGNEV